MTLTAGEFETGTGLPIITGYARMATHLGRFRVPLYSHVLENLYQGGTPAEVFDSKKPTQWLVDENGKAKFDKILCLYPWEYYPVPEGTEKHEFELYDAEDVDPDVINDLAEVVATWLRNGDRVLVHCQAGLNRSGLVAARALMKWKGMTPLEAIRTLRKSRCEHVLCNPYFEEFLMDF